jgi:hypothetical protein
VVVDEGQGEAVVRTCHTEYRCRLGECDYSKEDTYDMVPGLTGYAVAYGKGKNYEVFADSILIVVSDHEEYYFENAFVREGDASYVGSMKPHIGTFQDSCLLRFDGYAEERNHERCIDIRYFPHAAHLEVYKWDTAGLPVYLENAGDGVVYCTIEAGVMELKPGERRLVCRENMLPEGEVPVPAGGDLYPAFLW